MPRISNGSNESKASGKANRPSKPKSDYEIQTVTNALRMLEAFHSEAEIGVSDLARRLGLHKNNAFRLLATLEQGGYIQQSPNSELYCLGPRCLELGESFARSHTLMRQARPILEKLARDTGETAHLGVLQNGEVVHLDGVLPDQLVLTGLRVGERLPAHCTALGKTLLASLISSGQEADSAAESSEASSFSARPGDLPFDLLRDGEDLVGFTDATLQDPAKLVDELRSIRLRGYATDVEEYAQGLGCAAAPVRDTEGRVSAALSISGPIFRFPDAVMHGEIAGAITAAATELSRQLGCAI